MPQLTAVEAPRPAPLLTKQELAHHYRVGLTTVEKWLREGLPKEPARGRLVRIDLAKAEAWHAAGDETAA